MTVTIPKYKDGPGLPGNKCEAKEKAVYVTRDLLSPWTALCSS